MTAAPYTPRLNLRSKKIVQGDQSACVPRGWAKYRHDPIGFSQDILRVRLTEEQKTIALSVMRSNETNVQAAHGVGKTLISACLVIWWVMVVGGMAITTAPTERQVQELLWGEIRKMHNELDLPGDLGQMFLRLSEKSRAYGFTASKHNSNAFQGVHHAKLLIIEDEACGISEEIDDGAASCATGAENRFLRVGNPILAGVPFEKACKGTHIRIPVWGHPNVSWAYEKGDDGIHRLKPAIAERILDQDGKVKPQNEWGEDLPRDVVPGAVSIRWIEEVRQKKGEGSSFWQSRVEGLFPVDSNQSIIPRSWFWAARQRYDSNPEYWREQVSIQPNRYGLDVGDGVDDHAIARWQGCILWSARAIPTKGDQEDVTRAAGLAIAALESNAGVICVDRSGCGAGAQAILKEKQYPSTGVHWGEKAKDTKRFLNAKAEDYWLLREAFERGDVAIAPLGEWEEEAMEDLAGTYWEETSDGKIRMEGKEKTRKRLHRSPNVGDAIALGYRRAAEISHASIGSQHDLTGFNMDSKTRSRVPLKGNLDLRGWGR